MRGLVAACAFAAFAANAGVLQAQGLALPGANDRAPVEITAQEGIEWQQKARAYIARGRAHAAQGNSEVDADQLVAYYEGGEGQGQPTRITRIDADGSVKLTSPSGVATGTKAIYNVVQGILVLTGRPQLNTPTDRINARDSIEYWRDKNIVVARGDAVALREDKRLNADVLVGNIATAKDGSEKIVRIDAYDNVVVVTPTDTVRASRGSYGVETGIARLTGSVKITRCDGTQLNGNEAQVDMNSGKATLTSGPGGPVRGIIVPGEKGKTADGCPTAKR
jgi:lipopolysaccharide export system protein LptA